MKKMSQNITGVSTPICIVSGKSLLFLGNISVFGDSRKRIKRRDEGEILGRSGKCINYLGKLNSKAGKQC